MKSVRSRIPLCASVLTLLFAACASQPYNPAKATRAYPMALHDPAPPIDVQLFRDDATLRLVNATTRSFTKVDLWLNQRYVAPVSALGAGQTIKLSLHDFWDQWGGAPNTGGLLRRYDPTPIRLAQIQIDESTPLVNLVTIRAEVAEQEAPR